MKTTDLKFLSDSELLLRLSNVLKESRYVESILVAHIAEVDARRLYASAASPSMHRFCVDVLHLSDAEAYLRIAAARASRRFPALLTMLEDGRMHLSGIGVLAPHLSQANCADVLRRATHKTKQELKELVAELAPKPDVPPTIRKVPEPGKPTKNATPQQREEPLVSAHVSPPASAESTPSGPSTSSAPSSEPPTNQRDERQRVEPLSPARYKVQFTASEELRDKLARLSRLMSERELASVIEAAVTEKLERLEAKRYGKVKRPRKGLPDADTAPGVRGIAAPVRRVVWERDFGQCTFVSADGRRCPERDQLEFHHDEPYGLGGDRSPENVRLLCRAHNLYMAEQDYGRVFMDRFRRSADRVGEPTSAFLLGLDGVAPLEAGLARGGHPWDQAALRGSVRSVVFHSVSRGRGLGAPG